MVSLLKNDKGKQKALPPVTIHFLGTCSGGGPIASRNCSSLAVDFGNDIWLFDAADGTHARLHQSSLKMSNISRIFVTHMHADHVLGVCSIMTQVMSGIGVTEEQLEQLQRQGINRKASINVYGPPGLRALLRFTFKTCGVKLAGAYAVHELLGPDDQSSAACTEEDMLVNEAVGEDYRCDAGGVWRDILPQGGGPGGKGWSVSSGPIRHRVASHGYVLTEPAPRLPLDTLHLIPLLTTHASALRSRDPPIHHPLSILSYLTSLPPPPPFTLPDGTVIHPPGPSGLPGRKVVIFGDCDGGTENPAFRQMCMDASVLIHECTNAAIPERYQRGDKGRKVRVGGMEHSLVKKKEMNSGEKVGRERHNEEVEKHDNGNGGSPNEGDDVLVGDEVDEEQERRDDVKRVEAKRKAQSRGHCTPAEVGEFARSIKAKRVIVNHFSVMFPSPRYPSSAPFPSLLSPISPFPYPVPHPIAHSPDPPTDPLPLTSRELHLRIILQSLTDQISEVWNGSAPGVSPTSRNGGQVRQCVAARDFLVIRVPSHELDEAEVGQHDQARIEAEKVMRSWAKRGGVWVEESKGTRWVGVEDAPTAGGAIFGTDRSPPRLA